MFWWLVDDEPIPAPSKAAPSREDFERALRLAIENSYELDSMDAMSVLVQIEKYLKYRWPDRFANLEIHEDMA